MKSERGKNSKCARIMQGDRKMIKKCEKNGVRAPTTMCLFGKNG